MKQIVNIRGAVATGKTTAVRTFCEHYGFNVEWAETNRIVFPVSIINGMNVVVLGDYASTAKCTGLDPLKNKKKKSLSNKDLLGMISKVNELFNPDVIVYERMLTSLTCKGTKETADFCKMLGYEYYGVQLFCSEQRRASLLYKRSGVSAGTKTFSENAKRVDRATQMLNELGYFVERKNVENVREEDLWRIVDEAIKKTQ